MPSIHHGYPAQLAIALEDAQGQAPADWLAAEAGLTAAQLAHIECDPTFIRGEASVENQEHQADLYAEAQPLHGLKTADGGALKTYLHGAEAPTADGQQLAPTWQGRLLQHALGGGARGYATTIASVSSPTEFTVTSAQGLEPGHIIAIARQADPNRLLPVQVVDVSGVSVVIDRQLPAPIIVGDLIHPSEMAWPSPPMTP